MPKTITTDSWYSSKNNLKFFKDKKLIIGELNVIIAAQKQLCGLNKFLVRTSPAIANHIFCSLRAFCQLELMRIQETIESWYELQRELYLKVVREFIIKRLREQKNTCFRIS